jgi:hypothetical protein
MFLQEISYTSATFRDAGNQTSAVLRMVERSSTSEERRREKEPEHLLPFSLLYQRAPRNTEV